MPPDPDMQSSRDHEAILRRLEDLQETIKELVTEFRQSSESSRREASENFKEVWIAISEEKRRIDEALRTAESSKAVITRVAYAAITIAVGAFAKAIGVF